MKSNNNEFMCSPHCVYFPQTVDTINDEYIDEYGVVHRAVVRKCRYDGHEIKGWEQCSNREDIKNERT